MAEYIMQIEHPELCLEYGGTNYTDRLERIVRCKDCKKRLPKGWRFDKYCNEAEQDACNLFSDHDFDWNYTSFWYVKPNDFCVWGEVKE